MLERYKDDYKEFYTIMNNAINENRISHAYMFELDENIDQDQFIKDICKALISSKTKDELVLNLIDNDSYPNIKRIKPDGLWIKKEQIMEVQSDFKKESFDNNLKIYIIEDASKFNKFSANTLLKFLEEPEHDIVAILLTKNKYSVINTIVSRCINISLKNKYYEKIDVSDISFKIVELIEMYKAKSLPYLYQLVLNSENKNKDFLNIFEEVQKIYYDLLHINSGVDSKYNYYDSDCLKQLDFERDDNLIIKKIESISRNMEYLKNNVSLKAVLDKIIIEVYGGD